MSAEIQQRSTLRLVLIFCMVLSKAKPTTFSTVLVALCWIAATKGTRFSGKRPINIGVQSCQLAPCPNTPNCVNSQSLDAKHRIKPLTYNSTPKQAIGDLKKVIQNWERTTIITETENYLYAEFASAFWGFVDDVEFLLDENSKVIHVRSASRLGQSDMGVNRKRIETIRTQLNDLRKS
ncbi:MAG: DUF1499 domain-containing protein [Potamolinea sp.]